jgi:hypothetical protein
MTSYEEFRLKLRTIPPGQVLTLVAFYILLAVAIGLLLSLFAPSASACNRCGVFGRGCRFQSSYSSTYYAPVVHAAATHDHVATTQNFIFNNSYPVPSLGAPVGSPVGLPNGNSVYGYSLAASAYNVDPAQILDRSARLAEVAINGGQKALNDHNQTVQGALQLGADIDRRTKNTMLALAAIGSNQQPTDGNAQPLSLKATVKDGRLSIESLPGNSAGDAAGNGGQCNGGSSCSSCSPNKPSPNPPPAPRPNPTGLYGVKQCAVCHDGRGTNKTPTTFALDGSQPISDATYKLCAAAVMNGTMPPKLALDDNQKLGVLADLAKLVQ